eukprot:CAMPEP_0196663274 /NCGR_PEP_ID=MMETSP1086-20130531/52190_1 /TAXON_ID=77921 /ORGANISM="Cyanoptyche  gloeocystis , Strain SAG4.97" /LENGTH=89 /DNA_ID=CAMNT_0041999021 /DNA_START=405 /DNA_END=674 /DNA_ORIENTATION=+
MLQGDDLDDALAERGRSLGLVHNKVCLDHRGRMSPALILNQRRNPLLGRPRLELEDLNMKGRGENRRGKQDGGDDEPADSRLRPAGEPL